MRECVIKRIKMGENFLAELQDFKDNHDLAYISPEWFTSGGKQFQDAYAYYPVNDWLNLGINLESVYNIWKENPEIKCRFCLIRFNLKSYSTGKLKNIYIEIEGYERGDE